MQSMSKKYKLFVYGTLRKGCHNHYFMRDAKFISNGYTEERMCLVAHIDYRVPLTWLDSHGTQLKGELYEIDEQSLAPIHGMEINSGYHAKKMVIVEETGKHTIALVYCHYSPEKQFSNKYFAKIEDGDFLNWYNPFQYLRRDTGGL